MTTGPLPLLRILLVLIVMIGVIGCGKRPPTLSEGKPVSYWIAALHDPDVGLRRKAVAKLGNAGSTDPAVFPALEEALQDADAAVRCEAILAVVKFGRDAAPAIPILTEIQGQDKDEKVRAYAGKALQS